MMTEVTIRATVRLTFSLFFSFILLHSSVEAAVEPKYQDSVAVLMYHHIDEYERSTSTISPRLLRSQLMKLKKSGFHFITMETFRQFMNGGAVPPNAVLVTFDDGYESFYTHAAPVLRQLQVPAVNFYITKHLAGQYPYYVTPMRAAQLRMLKYTTPTIELQCHTHNLHERVNEVPLFARQLTNNTGRRESMPQYRQRLHTDIATCIKLLTPLNYHRVDSLAYPYGVFTKEGMRVAKHDGIRYAFTVKKGIVKRNTNRLLIPRINAGHSSVTPERLVQMILNQAAPYQKAP